MRRRWLLRCSGWRPASDRAGSARPGLCRGRSGRALAGCDDRIRANRPLVSSDPGPTWRARPPPARRPGWVMRRSPPAMPRNSPRAAATRSQIPGTGADRDADRALTALYSLHYRSLVKLAALLVADTAAAEEIVQDAFIAMHTA